MPDQQEAALPQGYQVGTTVVMPLPAERAYPLKEPDFLTLCDGTHGNERAGRDFHAGLFVSAVVGLIGLLSCVDWVNVFAQRRWMMLGCFLLLVAISAVSAWGCIHYWQQMRKENTPYTRLKAAILDFFQTQPAPNDAGEANPQI
jgi:hypothetical protein